MPDSYGGLKRSFRASSPLEDADDQPVKRQRPNAFAIKSVSLHHIHGDEVEYTATILPIVQPKQQLILPASTNGSKWPSTSHAAESPKLERRAAIPSDFCKFKTATNPELHSHSPIAEYSEIDTFSTNSNIVESVAQTIEQGILKNIYPDSKLQDKFNAIHALIDLAYATSFRSDLSSTIKNQRLFDRIFEAVFQILGLLNAIETHKLMSDRNFMSKINALKSRPWWTPSQDSLDWDWIGIYDLIDIMNPPTQLNLGLWKRKSSDYFCSAMALPAPQSCNDTNDRLAEVRNILEMSVRRGTFAKLSHRTCVESRSEALAFLALIGNWYAEIWRRERMHPEKVRDAVDQHHLVIEAMDRILSMSEWEEHEVYLQNSDFMAHIESLRKDKQGLFGGLSIILQQLDVPTSNSSLPQNDDVVGDLMMIEAY
jgi:hypothetical protein